MPLVEKVLADPTKRPPAILGSFVLDTVRRRLDPVPLRDGVLIPAS